jgi:hypothetical protein
MRLSHDNQMLKLTAVLLACFCNSVSWAGSGFSDEGNALFAALNQHLISVGVCENSQECHRVAPIYRRDGKSIEMNLYSATNPAVVQEVFGFVAAHGLRLTGGKEIHLNAFPKPKESYVNSFKGIRENRNPLTSLVLKSS